MEVWEIKATLCRSNPTLIRQFTASGERTLSEVGQILQILLGWSREMACLFYEKTGNREEKLSPENRLSEALADRKGLIVRFGEEGMRETPWVFRLLAVGTQEQEEAWPRVIRYRGDNPPPDCGNIRIFNRLQNAWESSGGYYFFDTFAHSHPKENFLFSVSRAQRQLKQCFSSSENGMEPEMELQMDYAHADDAFSLLHSKKVTELKEMEARFHLPLPSTLRKAERISEIAEYMERAEALDPILRGLTLHQYQVFQQICAGKYNVSGGNAMEEVRGLLEEWGYAVLYRYYYGDIELHYARQLLIAFEHWIDETDLAAYRKRAWLRSTIVACIRLYGYLSREQWLKIAPEATGQAGTEEEFDRAWKEISGLLSVNGLARTDEYFYNRSRIKPEEVKTLAAHLPADLHYIPKRREIRRLENNGLRYPQQTAAELYRFFRKEYNINKEMIDWLHGEIYVSLQYGADPEEYVHWLSGRLPKKGRLAEKRLKKLLERLNVQTRKVVCGGYTSREMSGGSAGGRIH